MGRMNDQRKFANMKSVGNFTKHAVENFESNIVNQTNYLEKVNQDLSDKGDNKLS